MNQKVLFTILCLCTLSVQADEQRQKPNVIFVLADDLGIGDLEPTNPDSQIKTPHLKTMASEGITFLDAHSSSSVCTPTRYGVLTGRYNWRSRLARGVLSGTSDHLIPAERATVAHLLRAASYHTQMIGKWHLGWDWAKVASKGGKGQKIDFTQPVTNGPNINGFDGYYAHCGSLDMPPYVWVDTGKATAIPQRGGRSHARAGSLWMVPQGADQSGFQDRRSAAAFVSEEHGPRQRTGAPGENWQAVLPLIWHCRLRIRRSFPCRRSRTPAV